jgi:hypothetical protein
LEIVLRRLSDGLLIFYNLITLPAIYRFISPGLKGDHSLLPAAGAYSRKHLPGAFIDVVVAIIAVTLRPSHLPASGAPLGLIGVAFGGEELLLLHGEWEGFATIDTCE